MQGNDGPGRSCSSSSSSAAGQVAAAAVLAHGVQADCLLRRQPVAVARASAVWLVIVEVVVVLLRGRVVRERGFVGCEVGVQGEVKGSGLSVGGSRGLDRRCWVG